MEVGAGTFHTATFLRAIGPEPWKAAYVQPSRRPKDGRYGENPNRLQHYYQYQVVLKPSPPDIQQKYIDHWWIWASIRNNTTFRFVEDDWESPTLGAWGSAGKSGSTAWKSRSSRTFRKSAASPASRCWARSPTAWSASRCTCRTRRNVFDLVWTPGVTYRDVYHQNEVEQSKYNFELSNTEMLFRHFTDFGGRGKAPDRRASRAPRLRDGDEGVAHVQPARCARRDLGHRARRLHRPRAHLARAVAQAYYESRERLGFPMAHG